MIDFQNWTNQRNFDRERLSLKRQYNQQVEYFQNNLFTISVCQYKIL